MRFYLVLRHKSRKALTKGRNEGHLACYGDYTLFGIVCVKPRFKVFLCENSQFSSFGGVVFLNFGQGFGCMHMNYSLTGSLFRQFCVE